MILCLLFEYLSISFWIAWTIEYLQDSRIPVPIKPVKVLTISSD